MGETARGGNANLYMKTILMFVRVRTPLHVQPTHSSSQRANSAMSPLHHLPSVLSRRSIRRPLALLTGLASAAVLGGCGTGVEPAARTEGASPSVPTAAARPAEAAAATPRLTVTYDGGVQVLDATTLEVLADLPLAGFNRLNPAGDGRHVMVSTEGGFRVLDAGTWGSSAR